jgi:hypothetical protein
MKSEAASPRRWKRSASVWPENALTSKDDWTLVDESGRRCARIYDAGRDDGVEVGNWRWRVYRPDGTVHGGSAESGAAAKKIAEELSR